MTTIKQEIRNRWTNAVQFTADITCAPDATIGVRIGLAVMWARQNDANLRDADLSGADLSDAYLSGANLSGAYLRGANLRGANLRGADLSGANLSDANLSGANLSDAYLSDAYLSDANLSDAYLSGAYLRGANLRGANLRDADLSDAYLRSANLSGAYLRGAYLRGANLSDANLRSFKADFWAILTTARKEIPGLITAMREGRIDGSTYSGECACLVGTIANVRHVSADTLEQDSSRPAEQWFLMIKKGDKPGDDSGGGFALQQALEWAEEYCALSGVKLPKPAKVPS